MELIEQLEYPLPILKILAEKIIVETSRNERGTLLVDNIGGGILSGRVMSNSPALKFDEQEFSGNQVSLDYSISIDGCRAGDVLQSEVVCMSNGGEKSIPVIIRVIPAFIVTAEDVRLTCLKDFLSYAKKYTFQARRLFANPEFMIWLTGIGYEYMDIFDHLVRDPNKERALENFFILSKLKNRAVLSADAGIIEMSVGPGRREAITGEIAVHKTGWGYVEADISVTDGEDWLKATPERLTAASFSAEDAATVKYSVNPSKLPGKLNKAVVKISGGIEISIFVKKLSHILAYADRACYEPDDTGVLRIANNCGEDIMLEISVRDSFVKFDGRKYFMGANAEIPFTVKLNALQSAQLGIKRRPFLETEIYVATAACGKSIKKTVRVMAGNRK